LFSNFNSDKTVNVAQTRFHNVSLPELVVLPAHMNLPASVELVLSLPAATHIVSPLFTLPEPSVPFSSKLAGAGLLLLPQLHQLLCQVLGLDWCCPQHVRALDREIYCCFAVCPNCYHWSALFAKQSDFVSILNFLLCNISSKVHDDTDCFVKFDGGTGDHHLVMWGHGGYGWRCAEAPG
jgi:hypothetical protein